MKEKIYTAVRTDRVNTVNITSGEYRELIKDHTLVEIVVDILENRKSDFDSDTVKMIESVLGVNYETAKKAD